MLRKIYFLVIESVTFEVNHVCPMQKRRRARLSIAVYECLSSRNLYKSPFSFYVIEEKTSTCLW